MLTLFWGTCGGRSGWFLNDPNSQLLEIRGASICTSSNGGALKALKIAREIYDCRYFESTIRITQAPHFTANGQPCNDPTCFGHEP